eukprot:13629819-Alexandrium_andersonii.AAC.1
MLRRAGPQPELLKPSSQLCAGAQRHARTPYQGCCKGRATVGYGPARESPERPAPRPGLSRTAPRDVSLPLAWAGDRPQAA